MKDGEEADDEEDDGKDGAGAVDDVIETWLTGAAAFSSGRPFLSK